MLLKDSKLISLVHGAVNIKKTPEDYLSFYRFSDEQINYYKFDAFYYDRAKFTASIIIKFKTNAKSFSFDYKLNSYGSLDSVDIYVNKVAYQFIELEKIAKEGTITIDLLDTNNKEVWIYLPTDAELFIKNFVVDGLISKVKKAKEKLLCFGDSITHGFGSYKASQTYINVMNRQLNFDLVNQGIGGYYYDRNQLITLDNFNPDKILVALGTNQIHSDDVNEQVRDYFEKLTKTYNNIPIFVLTPIWRNDVEDAQNKVAKIKNIILTHAKNYSNIYIIDGDLLVPHIECYYADLLHPNNFGMEVYGNNLVKELKKIIKKNKL